MHGIEQVPAGGLREVETASAIGDRPRNAYVLDVACFERSGASMQLGVASQQGEAVKTRKLTANVYMTVDGRGAFPRYPGWDRATGEANPLFEKMWIPRYDDVTTVVMGRRSFLGHRKVWTETARKPTDPKYALDFARYLDQVDMALGDHGRVASFKPPPCGRLHGTPPVAPCRVAPVLGDALGGAAWEGRLP